MLTTETNINTVRAVIDDDQHLSTRALEVFLHIIWTIILCILTKKLEMVSVAQTSVSHMLTDDQMRIYVVSTWKFMALITEYSTYLLL